MPTRNELLLSLVISGFLHVGLVDLCGRGLGDFLGLFTAYASLPVLYMAYGLCLWLSVVRTGRVLLERLEPPSDPHVQRTSLRQGTVNMRPSPFPADHAGAATGEQVQPTRPVLGQLPIKIRPTMNTRSCSSKGEQARRLRACREGQLGEPPFNRFSIPKRAISEADCVLSNTLNISRPDYFAPATASAKSSIQEVSAQLQPDAPTSRTQQPKRRVSGPVEPAPSPFRMWPNPYEEEFRRCRRYENEKAAFRAKHGLPEEKAWRFTPYVDKKAGVDEEVFKRSVFAPEPVVHLPQPFVPPSKPVVQPLQPVVKSSVALKVKARIEKAKILKARAHAVLDRQAKTMSLLDSSIRPDKKDEPTRKRKSCSPRRSIGRKVIKPPFDEPMDVDVYESKDSMDIDPPDPVDELCVRFAALF